MTEKLEMAPDVVRLEVGVASETMLKVSFSQTDFLATPEVLLAMGRDLATAAIHFMVNNYSQEAIENVMSSHGIEKVKETIN